MIFPSARRSIAPPRASSRPLSSVTADELAGLKISKSMLRPHFEGSCEAPPTSSQRSKISGVREPLKIRPRPMMRIAL